jgi:hypothetical protein
MTSRPIAHTKRFSPLISAQIDANALRAEKTPLSKVLVLCIFLRVSPSRPDFSSETSRFAPESVAHFVERARSPRRWGAPRCDVQVAGRRERVSALGAVPASVRGRGRRPLGPARDRDDARSPDAAFRAPFVRTNERTNGERGKYDERRFVTRADRGSRRRSSRALLFVSPTTANDAPLDEYCDRYPCERLRSSSTARNGSRL